VDENREELGRRGVRRVDREFREVEVFREREEVFDLLGLARQVVVDQPFEKTSPIVIHLRNPPKMEFRPPGQRIKTTFQPSKNVKSLVNPIRSASFQHLSLRLLNKRKNNNLLSPPLAFV
jgi:hypothetical protein